jgi:HEAT repeat protein
VIDPRLPPLLEALHSDLDDRHHEAYAALVALGGPAVPGLIETFPASAGRARLSIIRALGEIGDARAVALLMTLVRSRDAQEYLFVSSLAAKALGQIGARGGAPREQAVAGLVEMLGDLSAGSRRMSALVLGSLRDAEAVPALTAALGDDDTQVRALSARALGLIGAEGAVSALVVRLADTDALARPMTLDGDGARARSVDEAAAWALGRIDTPKARKAVETWRGKRAQR